MKCKIIFLIIIIFSIIALTACSVATSTITVPTTIVSTVVALPVTVTETLSTITATTTLPSVTLTTTPTITTPSTSTTTVSKSTGSINSESDLISYLTANFSKCQTSLGQTAFKFDVIGNNSINMPFDYWIQVGYDTSFFYDLKYSNQISTTMNNTICNELKAFQEKLAQAVIAAMLGKKLYGGYYYGYYKYPTIKEGYTATRYYSWVNYIPQSFTTNYDTAKITSFSWWDLIDEQLTR